MSDNVFKYAAGTAAATIDLPVHGDLQRVSVIAGASAATITIGAGSTITVPAGLTFDEVIEGNATGLDVVIGGSVSSYYVSWTA